VFDDGGGPALYAGGHFTKLGCTGIAKWDGSSWFALGIGLNDDVHSLAVFDDGSGPALYVGGPFTSAGGAEANRIAKWDGTSWSAVGSGLSGPFSPVASAMRVFDDGSGPALHVGGRFTTAGGVAANRVATWDGATWSALGSGVIGFDNASVSALGVFDDGHGPDLYVGGYFACAPDSGDSYLARWGRPFPVTTKSKVRRK
jgi:hypothetical protein